MVEEELLACCQERGHICMAEHASVMSNVLLHVLVKPSSKLQMLLDLLYPHCQILIINIVVKATCQLLMMCCWGTVMPLILQ